MDVFHQAKFTVSNQVFNGQSMGKPFHVFRSLEYLTAVFLYKLLEVVTNQG